MAELVAGNTTRLVLKSDGVLVGRRSNDGSFTPDVDLADLADGQTVSRRHARVFREDGGWRLQVEPSVTNDTVVGGRTLAAGEKASLTDGDEIRLGKVALVFRAGVEAPAANPDATIVRAVEAPAELRTDGQVFPLTTPEGRALTLGRHTEDRSYRPDVDLGDLPGGRTVSRRHGSFFTRNGQWFMRVESTTTNDTQHNGSQLAFGQEVPLAEGDQLQFGRIVTTFHEAPRVEAAGELIEVILDPPLTDVEAGGEAQISVTVINHTGHIDFFKIEVEGLPKEWYRIILPNGNVADPALVQLFHTAAHGKASADAVAKLRIVFAPPRDWKSRAGAHPIAVSATTQGEPRSRRVVTGQVTIRRFEDVRYELSPKQIRGSRGTYRLVMQNLGNDVATVFLATEGDGAVSKAGAIFSRIKRAFGFEAEAQGVSSKWDRQQVERGIGVASGGKDELVLLSRVQYRHWLGMERNYVVTVNATAGQARDSLRADLLCPPRIPWWLQSLEQRVLGVFGQVWAIVLPLIILAGVYLLFLQPPKITKFEPNPTSVVVGNTVDLSWSLDHPGPVTLESTGGVEKYSVADPKTDGKQTVKPVASTSYTLTAHNQYLGFISNNRSITVQVLPAPVAPKILSFVLQPDHLKKEGDDAKLTWQTDSATKVTITPADEIANPMPSGEATVHPKTSPAKYQITATGAEGTQPATKEVEVIIDAPQITSFTASPESGVVKGGDVRLRWTAQNFTKLTLKASKGEVVPGKPELTIPDGASDQIVRPLDVGEVDYTLTATNAGGSDSKVVKVTVGDINVLFKVDPPSIAKGDRATLTWSAPGAASIAIQPGDPVAPGEVSRTVQPDKTTEYTLTVTGPDGNAIQKKVTVTVGLGPVKIDFFTAAPATINKGDKATLTFSVQNAKHITMLGSDGKSLMDRDVSTPSYQGNVTVSPDQTTTYTLTVINDNGRTASPAVVTVAPPTPTPSPSPAATPPPKPKP